jgi:hypothetical protein
MTKKKLETHYPAGATPLEPEELEGLIPDYITTQGELNELELKRRVVLAALQLVETPRSAPIPADSD